MERISDLADPRRCQGASTDGQCRNISEEGDRYCVAHGGQNKAEPERRLMYQLTQAKHRARLAQLSEHEDVKSLRLEIGMIRMLIEEIWNNAKSDTERLQSYGQLNTMMLTLEKLIKTSHTMEQNLGSLLSKTTIVVLGQKIVNILISELQGVDGYEERIDRITTQMFDSIEQTQNSLEEK